MKHNKSDNYIQKELQQVAAAKENPARLNVLYDAYYKPIFIFVHRRTDDLDLTADITSQVFLKPLINIHTYEYKGVPFSAWLFRIAFNEVNMCFRKNNADRVVRINHNGMLQIAQEAEVEDDSEGIKQMMETVKKMEEADIQLIELRFFEKHSFAEVAEITENNAKVKVYRILDKLKKILKKNNV